MFFATIVRDAGLIVKRLSCIWIRLVVRSAGAGHCRSYSVALAKYLAQGADVEGDPVNRTGLHEDFAIKILPDSVRAE